ncbi:HNH endonuclease [Stutzerimonas frequens]|uniref:HNH endonuclease n=1 Tax=Stutzerimonas frequens TaxID=2968969 RepID=UPI00190D4A2E|nr:HNH endonuclease [Stutzerimonas frequens]MBK3759431.1 hypothetical protein [Stutzerimonas frequens]
MDGLRLNFMTLDGGFEIAVAPTTDDSKRFFIDLLSCFGELENNQLIVRSEQKATGELKRKVSNFTKFHSFSNPRLNRLSSIISNLAEGEYFLILEQIPADTATKHHLEVYLEMLNKTNGELTPEEFRDEINSRAVLFGELLGIYNIHLPRNDRRTIIGNAKKDDRKCRFCGGYLKDGATFSKVAHAIPEALGNKNLILADECDECNKYFGDNIEPNLIEYFDVYRAFLGVKGKNGAPTISYKNGKILHQDGMAVVVAEKIETTPESDLIVRFKKSKSFTPVKLYKALCKITLSTLSEQDLHGLSATLRWLRYEDSLPGNLPRVAVNVINGAFSKAPQITNYIRKTENSNLPHIVSEFKLGSFVYVYIVPFSTKDTVDFSDPSAFDYFWKQLNHYNQVPGWRFDKFDGAGEVSVNESIRMIRSNK